MTSGVTVCLSPGPLFGFLLAGEYSTRRVYLMRATQPSLTGHHLLLGDASVPGTSYSTVAEHRPLLGVQRETAALHLLYVPGEDLHVLHGIGANRVKENSPFMNPAPLKNSVSDATHGFRSKVVRHVVHRLQQKNPCLLCDKSSPQGWVVSLRNGVILGFCPRPAASRVTHVTAALAGEALMTGIHAVDLIERCMPSTMATPHIRPLRSADALRDRG